MIDIDPLTAAVETTVNLATQFRLKLSHHGCTVNTPMHYEIN